MEVVCQNDVVIITVCRDSLPSHTGMFYLDVPCLTITMFRSKLPLTLNLFCFIGFRLGENKKNPTWRRQTVFVDTTN